MNVNELRAALTNKEISLTHEDSVEQHKEQTLFTNSEIVILDDYTILDIVYDKPKKIVKLRIKKRMNKENLINER